MTDLQMQKIQWLSQAKAAQQKFRALENLRKRENSLLQQLQPFENCDDLFKHIQELQLQSQKQMLFLFSIQEEIRRQIDAVPDMQLQAILIRRYLNDETMEQIAEAMFYDLRTIQRKHKKALDFLTLPISETTIFPDISCEN